MLNITGWNLKGESKTVTGNQAGMLFDSLIDWGAVRIRDQHGIISIKLLNEWVTI
mgnify:CR=1 FL=1